jgi:hypothetical protein
MDAPGGTLAALWKSYRENVIAKDTDPHTMQVFHSVFYAGALAVGHLIMGLMHNRVLSEAERAKRYQAILDELAAYAALAQTANALERLRQANPAAIDPQSAVKDKPDA